MASSPTSTDEWEEKPNREAKSSWPELVGAKGEEAAATIKKENPSLHVHILIEGSFITFDWRTDRVRVWIDEHGVVTKAPMIS